MSRTRGPKRPERLDLEKACANLEAAQSIHDAIELR